MVTLTSLPFAVLGMVIAQKETPLRIRPVARSEAVPTRAVHATVPVASAAPLSPRVTLVPTANALPAEGLAGVAVMVDTLTDNRNRTSASIRHRFSKLGGNLAESNAVGWMFERKGVISANAGNHDPEEVALAAIEAGADDVQVEGKSVEITAPPQSFEKVKAAVEAAGVAVDNAEITMQPKQTVPVGEDKAAAVLRLMESLEEDDDVQQVYANFDIPTNVLERVSAQV